MYNSSFDLQHFYSSFVNALKCIIHRYVPLFKKTNRPKYPAHIKRLLNAKKLLYKKSKLDSSWKKLYKIKCKEYQSAVNVWNDQREQRLCENPGSKKFYNFVNKKLISRASIPPLMDHSQKLLTSDQDKANFLNSEF